MTAPVMLEHDWFPHALPHNVEIGAGSWLYSSYALLHNHSRRPCGLRIGQHSGIYIGTMFELGPEGEVEIGDYCAIAGPIISTNGRIAIGDYAFISYGVVLADSLYARPFESSDVAGTHSTSEGAEIVLGENVWIGARAVVLPGARIGEGAIIGAAAVVDFPVPPYAVVAGNPARVVGSAGPRGSRPAVGRAFR